MYFFKFHFNFFGCIISIKFIIIVEASKIHKVLNVPDT